MSEGMTPWPARTLEDFRLLCRVRDARYSTGKAQLTSDETENVRHERLKEVGYLPAQQRSIAWAEVQQWRPPTPRGIVRLQERLSSPYAHEGKLTVPKEVLRQIVPPVGRRR